MSGASGAIGQGAIGTFIIGGTQTGGPAPVPSPTQPVARPTAGNTFYLEWNGDFVLTSNGSILMAQGWDQVRERIIRRFLTNSALPLPDGTTTPPDYVFSPLYGLGAGALIDQNPDQTFLTAFTRRMREAVVADAATAPGAMPSIQLTTPMIGMIQVYVGIQLISGQQGSFAITFGSGTGS
jgi:hypothetical protein